MNSEPSLWIEALRSNAQRLGATAIGLTEARETDSKAEERFNRWIEAGMNAGMAYMANHAALRHDPRRLLDGASTIIALAFNYYNPLPHPEPGRARFSRYALGDDYHDALRERLETLARWIRITQGGETRVTVDTAPIHERYWAQQAGLGVVGKNSMLIVNGAGSYQFIGLILWTGSVPQPLLNRPSTGSCLECGKCVKACPAGAITEKGVDARRCHSYLTIELRDERLPEGTTLPEGRVYGCDICQEVCPMNADVAVTEIPEFSPRKIFETLTISEIAAMDQPTFSTLFRKSAVKRAKLTGLRRNALHIMKK